MKKKKQQHDADSPDLGPPPRSVPLDWWLRNRLGFAAFMFPIFAAMLGLFIGVGLYQNAGISGFVVGVTACGGYLLGQQILFWWCWKFSHLLRNGVAVQPKVLSAEETTYSVRQEGNTFDIYSGWRKVKVVESYDVVEKELRLELPDGKSHTFTESTYPQRPPIYLVDPRNPKRYEAILHFTPVPVPGPDSAWPDVSPSAVTIVLTTLNGIAFVSALAGLLWCAVLLANGS